MGVMKAGIVHLYQCLTCKPFCQRPKDHGARLKPFDLIPVYFQMSMYMMVIHSSRIQPTFPISEENKHTKTKPNILRWNHLIQANILSSWGR